jgi:hypothetical protein
MTQLRTHDIVSITTVKSDCQLRSLCSYIDTLFTIQQPILCYQKGQGSRNERRRGGSKALRLTTTIVGVKIRQMVITCYAKSPLQKRRLGN